MNNFTKNLQELEISVKIIDVIKYLQDNIDSVHITSVYSDLLLIRNLVDTIEMSMCSR